ncbi:MAG: glycosyltransferase family 39 protein [Anaerolineae bacterium]
MSSPQRARVPLLPIFLLAGLILLGLALRLYRLDTVPLGLHHDEGYNALDAMNILDGWRPVFLPGNFGREPLFIYGMAAAIALFSPIAWSIRLPGALSGALAIPAQFLFANALPLPRPRVTAILSAALIAVSFWPITKAHQGLRAGLLPVWVALALWAWWRGVRRDAGRQSGGGGDFAWAALAGVFVAAGNYTHLNARLLPIVLLGSALWIAVRERRARPLALWLTALAVALALCLPLIQYFAANPDLLGLRSSQVSIFSPQVNGGNLAAALAHNTANILLMFTVRGTSSWWENIAGRPIFDPLLGLAFLVGLGFLVRDLIGRRGRPAQAAAVLLLFAFVAMLVPSWLSEEAPNYGRLTGIWPVLYLLPAWAIERGGAWLDTRRASLGLVGMALIVAVSGAWSAWDFFGRYATAPEVHDVYRGAAFDRGAAVAAEVAQGPTYVSPGVWDQPVIRLINRAAPPRSFDPRHGIVLPPQGDARYVMEGWEAKDGEAFRQRWGLTPDVVKDANGAPALLVYRLDAAREPGVTAISPLTFGENMRLVGAEIAPDAVRPGGSVAVTLAWQALAPTPTDLNFFVHLVRLDGSLAGQFDGPPLGGSYATTDWAPGERIIGRVEAKVADDAPPGSLSVQVGWYDWRTGERLPTSSGRDGAAEIGTVTVQTRR